MTGEICEHFHIAASHPALAGHFPDNPIVPGVILLERVAAAARRAFAVELTGLPQVKFLHPLRPGETVELRIERSAASARFSIRHGREFVATGMLELAP